MLKESKNIDRFYSILSLFHFSNFKIGSVGFLFDRISYNSACIFSVFLLELSSLSVGSDESTGWAPLTQTYIFSLINGLNPYAYNNNIIILPQN